MLGIKYLTKGFTTNKVQSLESNSLFQRKPITQQDFLTKLHKGRNPAVRAICPRPVTCHCLQYLLNEFLSSRFLSSEPIALLGGDKPMRSWWSGCVLTLVIVLRRSSVLQSLATPGLVNSGWSRAAKSLEPHVA